jgi:hypothetical protein
MTYPEFKQSFPEACVFLEFLRDANTPNKEVQGSTPSNRNESVTPKEGQMGAGVETTKQVEQLHMRSL